MASTELLNSVNQIDCRRLNWKDENVSQFCSPLIQNNVKFCTKHETSKAVYVVTVENI